MAVSEKKSKGRRRGNKEEKGKNFMARSVLFMFEISGGGAEQFLPALLCVCVCVYLIYLSECVYK